jgi:regulator of replication initiation timing
MIIYFEHYADSQGFMNFEKYTKFCKDFGLFPDILSKAKMLNLFHTLSSVHKNAQKEIEQQEAQQQLSDSVIKKPKQEKKKAPEQTEDDLIDQHLFTEGIALAAFEVPHFDPQPSNLEKVLF